VNDLVDDIVALLTESGLEVRRERAAFVGRLRDQFGMTFSEIAKQLNVSFQRAHQLYKLHRLFQRRPFDTGQPASVELAGR
jgi:DNA-directed RNA polymerase sigma subunit (sigma70/sigma32)